MFFFTKTLHETKSLYEKKISVKKGLDIVNKTKNRERIYRLNEGLDFSPKIVL